MGLSASRTIVILIKLLFLAFLADGYTIDGSTCSNPTEIQQAVDEALNMAAYASYRASKEKAQVPTVVNTLLGAQGPNIVGGRYFLSLNHIHLVLSNNI
jgi:hypothetical protein